MKELEIIKTALEAEEVSLITYLDFVRKTRDGSGKNMFIRLAMDEFSHMRLLKEQKENLLNKGDWAKVRVERSKLEELVPKLKGRAVKTKGLLGIDEIDALNTALQLEDVI